MFLGVNGRAPGSWKTMVTMSFPMCLFLRSCAGKGTLRVTYNTVIHTQPTHSLLRKDRRQAEQIPVALSILINWVSQAEDPQTEIQTSKFIRESMAPGREVGFPRLHP